MPLQVSPSSKFQEDLGLDSLDSVEVGAGLDDSDKTAIRSKGAPGGAALDVKTDCAILGSPALNVWEMQRPQCWLIGVATAGSRHLKPPHSRQKLFLLQPCFCQSAYSQVATCSAAYMDCLLVLLCPCQVVMAFEEEFAVEIPDSEADKILSTSDAIEYIAAHPQAK